MHTIENITLQTQKHPEELSFSKTEHTLYQIVRNTPEEALNQAAKKSKNAEIAREICFERGDVLQWVPFSGQEDVLEIGSAYGAVSGVLAGKCKRLTCLASTDAQGRIAATRHSGKGNIEIVCGPLETTLREMTGRKFDGIVLMDGLDTILEMERARDFVKVCFSMLSPGGRLFLGARNRYAMKHWSGCYEAGKETLFAQIEGRDGLHTLSSVRAILSEIPDVDTFWYFPYPDAVNPYALYSQEREPKVGDLIFNDFRWEKRRAKIFDETLAWDGILEQKMFSLFANAFLIEVRRKGNEDEFPRVEYAKFSPTRAAHLRMQTRIERGTTGRVVRKAALGARTQGHIDHMEAMYEGLASMYAGSRFQVNRMRREGDTLAFEYLEGNTLCETLLQDIRGGKREAFLESAKEFFDAVRSFTTLPFSSTGQFSEIFPQARLPEGMRCAAYNDLDLNFDNILVCGGKWNIIDFEFTYDFPIPVDFILYRAVFYLFRNHPWMDREGTLQVETFRLAGVQEGWLPTFRRMEKSFQQYVSGTSEALQYMDFQREYTMTHFAKSPKIRKLRGILGSGLRKILRKV